MIEILRFFRKVDGVGGVSRLTLEGRLMHLYLHLRIVQEQMQSE